MEDFDLKQLLEEAKAAEEQASIELGRLDEVETQNKNLSASTEARAAVRQTFVDFVAERQEPEDVTCGDYYSRVAGITQQMPIGTRIYAYISTGMIRAEFATLLKQWIKPSDTTLDIRLYRDIQHYFTRPTGGELALDMTLLLSQTYQRTTADEWATREHTCDLHAGQDGVGCIGGVYWRPGYAQGVTCQRCRGKGYMSKADKDNFRKYRQVTNSPLGVAGKQGQMTKVLRDMHAEVLRLQAEEIATMRANHLAAL
ncbi:hypothetical protein ACPV5S_15770 [Vibrio astriarenae]